MYPRSNLKACFSDCFNVKVTAVTREIVVVKCIEYIKSTKRRTTFFRKFYCNANNDNVSCTFGCFNTKTVYDHSLQQLSPPCSNHAVITITLVIIILRVRYYFLTPGT